MSENPEKSSKSRVKVSVDLQMHSKNALNNSSSKMQYSIPKSSRWNGDKNAQQGTPKFYDLPSIHSNRSASFGYGNKMDISKQNVITPAPGTYIIEGDLKMNKNRAISVGLGRDLIKAVSTFGEKPFQCPGPASYIVKYQDSQQKVSMSGRNIDISDKWILSVPGPGSYKTLELIDKNLKSINSKFQSCKAGKFDKSIRKSQEEIRSRVLEVPGPGKYKVEQKYEFVERFSKNRGQRFSHSQRQGISQKSITPGPGAYSCYSEFLH